MMNQEGYTHLNYENTGSFRDFIKKFLHGQFLPVADVSDGSPQQTIMTIMGTSMDTNVLGS